jgi:hypothetical protein
MKDQDEQYFRTLRGFLEGSEPDEALYFAYSATLRIFGDIPDLDVLTRLFGVAPTTAYRRGERRTPRCSPARHDMWQFTVPIAETEPLHVHIDALWSVFRVHKADLLELKRSAKVDVFLGYRSNCDHAGVEVPVASLEMFTELQIPFGISIIVA